MRNVLSAILQLLQERGAKGPREARREYLFLQVLLPAEAQALLVGFALLHPQGGRKPHPGSVKAPGRRAQLLPLSPHRSVSRRVHLLRSQNRLRTGLRSGYIPCLHSAASIRSRCPGHSILVRIGRSRKDLRKSHRIHNLNLKHSGPGQAHTGALSTFPRGCSPLHLRSTMRTLCTGGLSSILRLRNHHHLHMHRTDRPRYYYTPPPPPPELGVRHW